MLLPRVGGIEAPLKPPVQFCGATSNGITQALITNSEVGNLRTTGGNTILNTYGSAYAIAGSVGSFTITDPGVPQADCAKILKQIPATGYIQVAVNGAAAINAFPITVATAQAACNAVAGAGNSIAVTAQ